MEAEEGRLPCPQCQHENRERRRFCAEEQS